MDLRGCVALTEDFIALNVMKTMKPTCHLQLCTIGTLGSRKVCFYKEILSTVTRLVSSLSMLTFTAKKSKQKTIMEEFRGTLL